MNVLVYPTVGQTMFVPTLVSLTLYWLHTLLASLPNHLTLALYSCYLMKLLYNMILLPSHTHSNVIKNQHCRALPVVCCSLIVLRLMISGNVHVHPGSSTVARPKSDLCSDFCFTDFCSRKSLGFLHVKPPDQVLKQWDSLNRAQIITNPTRYVSKHPEKANPLDVILSNNPDRYQSGAFCNDLCDHCFTACVHNGCSVKRPVLICHRHLLKNFNEQVFLHGPSIFSLLIFSVVLLTNTPP